MGIKGFLVFCLGLTGLVLCAQPNSDVIGVKQKFLMRPLDEIKEQVDSFRTLHLMVAGNIYQTEMHINYAYNAADSVYDFKEELKYVQPILNLGDISIANLKTSFGDNVKDMFSAPDEFALAIKYSGINAVMHANMHTANIDRPCLKRTRDVLNEFDMYHTGAFTDFIERTGNYPLIITKKGFKIAILNYANMVNRPSVSRDFFINEIDKSYIDKDMMMVRASKPDFTIVYFDWGENAHDIPSHQQQEITRYVFEKGADLVVGACTNSPMNLDFLNYYYKGKAREGIVAYSLGNLIASNEEVKNRNGYIIDMEITKNNFTGDTKVADWGVIPVYTYYDTTTVKGKTKVYSVPCWAVESGDIFPKIPYIEKRRVANSAYEVRKMLGAVADEVQYNMTEHVVDNVAEAILITSASLNNKFSQKRAWEIKPTAAPVLPVSLNGSSEAPSLAKVRDDSNTSLDRFSAKNSSAKESNLAKEKDKAKEIFGTAVKPPAEAVNSPQTDDKLSAKDNSPPVSNQTKANNQVAVNTPANKTKAESENTVKMADTSAVKPKTGVSSNPPDRGDNKTNAKTTASVPPPDLSQLKDSLPAGKNVQKNSAGNDSKPAVVKTTAKNEDDKTTTKKEPAGSQGVAKGNTAANTNYHTTGNPYSLKEPEITPREKNAVPLAEKTRAKQSTVEMTSVGAEGVSAKTTPAVKGDMTPVKGKVLAVEMDTVYRIQFYAMKKYLPLDTNYYPHLKGYDVYEENGLYKYVLGEYRTYQACYDYWKGQIQPRYKESFIVKFINGKRVLK